MGCDLEIIIITWLLHSLVERPALTYLDTYYWAMDLTSVSVVRWCTNEDAALQGNCPAAGAPLVHSLSSNTVALQSTRLDMLGVLRLLIMSTHRVHNAHISY